MAATQADMMTKLIGAMLNMGRPVPKKAPKSYERAGVVLHIYNGGFLDRSEVKDEADFVKSRVHKIVQVPILREAPQPITKPKQGKREARRRKRVAARIAARQPLALAA